MKYSQLSSLNKADLIIDNNRFNDVDSYEEKMKLFVSISEKRNKGLFRLRQLLKSEDQDKKYEPTEEAVKVGKMEHKLMTHEIFSAQHKSELCSLNDEINQYRARLRIKKRDRSTKKMINKFNMGDTHNGGMHKRLNLSLDKLPALDYQHMKMVFDQDNSDKTENINLSLTKKAKTGEIQAKQV